MNNNTNSMNTLDTMLDNLTTTALDTLKSENIGGVETSFFEFNDTVKDEDGKDKIIVRKVTNPTLVASFVKIQTIDMLSKYSTTILAFELSKLTKEQAEMYKSKSIMDLVYKVFPNLTIDRTTATKYRKAGLLFMDRTKDAKFAFRNGIDYDTSINTLERCITLASVDEKGEKVDIEKATEEELEKLYNNFYQKYVISGKINLNASQSRVKEQISAILKDSEKVVATIKAEDVKEVDNSTTTTENSENTENSGSTQELSDKKESCRASAEEHINLLKTLFKDNKSALQLLSKLVKELTTLAE